VLRVLVQRLEGNDVPIDPNTILDEYPPDVVPPDVAIRILREEVTLLRAEAGRCDSTKPADHFTSTRRCRKPRSHIGMHRAFGSGGDGHGGVSYWFTEWK
jgi:hypothetical protein